MALFSNTKMKGSLYFLFFLLGLILCGYLYYFLFYIPAREARLNDEAISTIRNIREGIVAKEKHYTQLLQTSHDLDHILEEKVVHLKSLDSLKKGQAEFNKVAENYINSHPNSKRESVVLKHELEKKLGEILQQEDRDNIEQQIYEKANKVNRKNKTPRKPNPGQIAKQKALKDYLVEFLERSNWEKSECLRKDQNGNYIIDTLTFIYTNENIALLNLKYTNLYILDVAIWESQYSSIANSQKYKALLSDTIIAANYRDQTLKILSAQSNLGIESGDNIKLIHQDAEQNKPKLTTIKQGLERRIIITKKNDHLEEHHDDDHHKTANDTLSGMVIMEDFMSGVADSKLFDCVVLFDDSTIFYTNDPRILSKQSADSLSLLVNNNMGIDIREQVFNGKRYMQYTAPISIGNEAFHITGLINNVAYTTYTKGVQYHILIVILLLAMFLVSIVPSVKIFVITEWERLKAADVTFAGIGILLGVFVLCILFVTIGHYDNLKKDTKSQLDHWNREIENSISDEIEQTIDVLQKPYFGPDSNSTTIFHEFAILDKSGDLVELHLPYGKTSKVDVDGSYFTRIGKKTNLGKRKYFSSFSEGTSYRFQSDTGSTLSTAGINLPFYIQAVFSHKRGKKEAVISTEDPHHWMDSYIKSKGRVRIQSTDLQSVMLRTAPLGFQYAIINKQGDILFSSDPEKNGLRNIFKQTVDHAFMGQAMQANAKMSGTFVHGRQTYIGVIAPISKITKDLSRINDHPLYVLTYANKSINTWKTSTASIILGATGFMLIFLFLIIRALFWVLRYRHTDGPLAPTHFNRWLAPKEYKRKTYIVFAWGCIPALLILLFTFIFQGIENTIVIALMNVFYISGLRYALLAMPREKCLDYEKAFRRFKISNGTFWIFYALCSALLFRNYWLSGQTSIWVEVVIWFAVSQAILYKAIYSSDNFRESIRKKLPKWSKETVPTAHIYTSQIVIWISILLVAPMLLTAYNGENMVENTFSNFAYHELSERNHKREIAFNSDYKNYFFNKDSLKGPYADFQVVAHSTNRKTSNVENVPDSTFTNKLFNLISRIYPLQSQIQPVATVDAGIAKPHFKNSIFGLFLIFFVITLTLSIAVWAFTRRIFFNINGMLRSASPKSWPSIYNKADNYTNFLFVSPPKSTIKSAIHSVTGKNSSNPKTEYNLDFDTIPGIKSAEFDFDKFFTESDTEIKSNELLASEVLVFTNWYAFNTNGHELENKLILLTRILDKEECKTKSVILLSSASIQQIESYIKGKSFEKNASFNSRIYFKHFKSIFRRFHEVVFPIDHALIKDNYNLDTATANKLEPGENLLLKSQFLTPTYIALWNSLSPEEKFVLYDIADDGMVNSKNWNTILLLKRKKLIVYDASKFAFACFDEAFAYYVRQSISQDEALEMETLAKKKGSWVPIKVALILIVVALFGLVYNFNPSVLQGFVGILSGIATAIAAFGKITTSLKVPFITKK